jgi:hypothetical protein
MVHKTPHKSVFIGVPVAQSVDVCGVLWTIVVHSVFIGVPVAQSVDSPHKSTD